MAHMTVQARPRAVVGKKVKTLRRKGILPANIYGHNQQSLALELDAHQFSLLQRHLPANAMVDLQIEGEGSRTRPAIIHRTQRDVRTGRPIHVEFFQFNPRERMTASVPIVLAGEPELVRRGEAILIHVLHSLEVTALPADLPPQIEVQASALQALGDTVVVSDLPIDRDLVEVRVAADEVVLTLRAPQMRQEAEEAAAAPAAAEATSGDETA